MQNAFYSIGSFISKDKTMDYVIVADKAGHEERMISDDWMIGLRKNVVGTIRAKYMDQNMVLLHILLMNYNFIVGYMGTI